MKHTIYYKNGKKYKKLNRDEVIKEGAMHSFCQGELSPIANTDSNTVGRTSESFPKEREFYNPIN